MVDGRELIRGTRPMADFEEAEREGERLCRAVEHMLLGDHKVWFVLTNEEVEDE